MIGIHRIELTSINKSKATRKKQKKKENERDEIGRESDPENYTGNRLDALLHSFHCLLAINAMMRAEGLTATCKYRVRTEKERRAKKSVFIDEQKKLYLLPLGWNGS